MEESNTPSEHPKQSKIVAIIIGVVTILAVTAVTALIIANPLSAPKSTDQTTTNVPANGETATITATDDGFTPSTLTVKKGTTVTITNNSSSPIEFSSDAHPTHRDNPEINMSELAPGESDSFVVSTTGMHGFHDHLRDEHTGTLTVTD